MNTNFIDACGISIEIKPFVFKVVSCNNKNYVLSKFLSNANVVIVFILLKLLHKRFLALYFYVLSWFKYTFLFPFRVALLLFKV